MSKVIFSGRVADQLLQPLGRHALFDLQTGIDMAQHMRPELWRPKIGVGLHEFANVLVGRLICHQPAMVHQRHPEARPECCIAPHAAILIGVHIFRPVARQRAFWRRRRFGCGQKPYPDSLGRGGPDIDPPAAGDTLDRARLHCSGPRVGRYPAPRPCPPNGRTCDRARAIPMTAARRTSAHAPRRWRGRYCRTSWRLRPGRATHPCSAARTAGPCPPPAGACA